MIGRALRVDSIISHTAVGSHVGVWTCARTSAGRALAIVGALAMIPAILPEVSTGLTTPFAVLSILAQIAEAATCLKVTLLAVFTSLSALLTTVTPRAHLITSVASVASLADAPSSKGITIRLTLAWIKTSTFETTPRTPPTSGALELAQRPEESSWTIASSVHGITASTIVAATNLRTAGSKPTFWTGGTAVIPLGPWWTRAEACLWMTYEYFGGTWTLPSHGNDKALRREGVIVGVVVRGQGSEAGLHMSSDTNGAFGFTFPAPFPGRTG